MNRFCPNCHGANVRRSSTPATERTWRNNFLSRYRCRECLTQFWVISRKTYTAVATFAGAVVLVVIGVILMEMVFTRQTAPPTPARRRSESAPLQHPSLALPQTRIGRESERS
jgi:hypothetical protein